VRDNVRTMLLVEDNESDVALTRRALQRGNIHEELVVAEDGQAALDFLLGCASTQEHSLDQLPALVLLDLKLPRVPGLEVLRRIREDARIRHLPVVVLTTSTELTDRHTSYALGANSFLHKPMDYAEFADSLRQICSYWLRMNRPPYEE